LIAELFLETHSEEEIFGRIFTMVDKQFKECQEVFNKSVPNTDTTKTFTFTIPEELTTKVLVASYEDGDVYENKTPRMVFHNKIWDVENPLKSAPPLVIDKMVALLDKVPGMKETLSLLLGMALAYM